MLPRRYGKNFNNITSDSSQHVVNASNHNYRLPSRPSRFLERTRNSSRYLFTSSAQATTTVALLITTTPEPSSSADAHHPSRPPVANPRPLPPWLAEPTFLSLDETREQPEEEEQEDLDFDEEMSIKILSSDPNVLFIFPQFGGNPVFRGKVASKLSCLITRHQDFYVSTISFFTIYLLTFLFS